MWKVDQILALFAPFDCLGCQTEGALLCRDCLKHRVPKAPGCCYRCLKSTKAALCLPCRTKTELDQVWAVSAYQDISRQLVSRLKFSRTQAAASIIARIIDGRLPSLPADTIVVHVPTANQRVRQRGYDQAQLIARELARVRGFPYQALLRRHGKTRQVGANRQERLEQLQKAYQCPFPLRVERRKILLVDDVLTTGATIETAAKVLKMHGAAEVRAALFGQKV
jgi:ComF family protein